MVLYGSMELHKVCSPEMNTEPFEVNSLVLYVSVIIDIQL